MTRPSMHVVLLTLISSLLCLRGLVHAQEPPDDEAGPRPVGQVRVIGNGLPNEFTLLSMSLVQRELELTAAQQQLVTEIHRAEVAEMPGGFGARGRTPQQRREFQEVEEKRADENGKRVAAALSEAQRKRLDELWVQRQREGALRHDARVIAELDLTDDQLRRLADDAPRLTYGGLFDTQQAQQERLAKALQVLTEEQRDKYKMLTGEPFDFGPPPQFGAPLGQRGAAPGARAGELTKASLGPVIVRNGLPDQYSQLSTKEIRQEVGLSDEVIAVLEEMQRKAEAKSAEYVENRKTAEANAERAESARERFEMRREARELGNTYSQAMREDAEANEERLTQMLTEAQRQRLAQLWLQAAGVNAFLDEAVLEQLGLDDDQSQKVRDAARRRSPFERGMTWPEHQVQVEEVLELLTDKQRAAFAKLRGETYAFSEVPAYRRVSSGVAGVRGGQRSPAGRASDAALRGSQRFAASMIRRYDANGDGVLQADEWKSIRPSPAAADVNADGDITVDEFADWLRSQH